jgi:hypothetical protein
MSHSETPPHALDTDDSYTKHSNSTATPISLHKNQTAEKNNRSRAMLLDSSKSQATLQYSDSETEIPSEILLQPSITIHSTRQITKKKKLQQAWEKIFKS